MKGSLGVGLSIGAVVIAGTALLSPLRDHAAFAQGRLTTAPPYRVEPFWPRPLPNHWVLGSITGVSVDGQDHVWVVHRGADSLEVAERHMTENPPGSSVCCTPAPLVLQFDTAGKLLSSFGGPGEGYRWPQSPGGIAVDAQSNVWITAAGLEPASASGRGGAPPPAAFGTARVPADAHVLEFSRSGQFMRQIGEPGKMEGPDSHTTLNRPAAVAIDDAVHEVYVADSGNHRLVVFDATTGAYKRHWGAYGGRPTAAGAGAYDPNAAPSRQFRDVTCVEMSKDGMVYVCDRTSNRIQVFRKDGTFVKEAIVSKNTLGATVSGQFGVVSSYGSVWDLAFSNDPQQRYVFVADGHDKKVIVLQRDTLTQVSTIGSGGRYPGQFLAVDSVAVDSQGNLYTGEQHHGKRVQKFVLGR